MPSKPNTLNASSRSRTTWMRPRTRSASIPRRSIANARSLGSSERPTAMLRTRLLLGLVPLLLIVVGVGLYAISVSRELAGTLSGDLASNYRAIGASQQMRVAITFMSTLAGAKGADAAAARQSFEEQRATFRRELMDQAANAAGSARGPRGAALGNPLQLAR